MDYLRGSYGTGGELDNADRCTGVIRAGHANLGSRRYNFSSGNQGKHATGAPAVCGFKAV